MMCPECGDSIDVDCGGYCWECHHSKARGPHDYRCPACELAALAMMLEVPGGYSVAEVRQLLRHVQGRLEDVIDRFDRSNL